MIKQKEKKQKTPKGKQHNTLAEINKWLHSPKGTSKQQNKT